MRSVGEFGAHQQISTDFAPWLGFVTAATSLSIGQPNFARCLSVSWTGTLYIHSWGCWSLTAAKFTLHPSLTSSYICSVTARLSSRGITELSQRVCWLTRIIITELDWMPIHRKEMNITVSTVVLNCCKGDKPSQWETPIFRPRYSDPCSSKTPWPILMKFVTSDYVVDPTAHGKLGFQDSNGSVPP